MPARWRSPVRGPWLTSVFGVILLAGIPVEFLTGLLSYAAYDPGAGNDPNPAHGLFGAYLFRWITAPPWVYRVLEGIHVVLGLALVPVVLAKLWSVMPRLFAWPPWTTVSRLLERLSVGLVVGGVMLELTTGTLDIQYDGHIDFYSAHFYGAWAFIAGFALHVALKWRDLAAGLRSRSLLGELRTGLDATVPEPAGPLVAAEPDPPTISRRGVLGLVGAASAVVALTTVGEAIGGGLRRTALFGTHDRLTGTGANRFPVNNTAAYRGITAADVGDGWRLELVGPRPVRLSRPQLTSLPQRGATLPIACTEGWSTEQRWSGVPLATLARMAGARHPAARLESVDGGEVTLTPAQVAAPDALLALRVNGAPLSVDHGYPARVVVPDAPGTHCRKWVVRITFLEGR